MQQLGDGENLSPEEEAELQKANQINSIQEMTVRFSIYDIIIKLNQKLDQKLGTKFDIKTKFDTKQKLQKDDGITLEIDKKRKPLRLTKSFCSF